MSKIVTKQESITFDVPSSDFEGINESKYKKAKRITNRWMNQLSKLLTVKYKGYTLIPEIFDPQLGQAFSYTVINEEIGFEEYFEAYNGPLIENSQQAHEFAKRYLPNLVVSLKHETEAIFTVKDIIESKRKLIKDHSFTYDDYIFQPSFDINFDVVGYIITKDRKSLLVEHNRLVYLEKDALKLLYKFKEKEAEEENEK